MSKLITLPTTVTALRSVIRKSIEHYQGSPVKKENKLNESLAAGLDFDNFDQLSAAMPVESSAISVTNLDTTTKAISDALVQSMGKEKVSISRDMMAQIMGYKDARAMMEAMGEEEITPYEIEYDSDGEHQLVINRQRIDVDLVHEEIVAYTVADREERISDLRMWISEAQDDPRRQNDVPLMQEDLDTLLESDSEWVLEAYGTNGFVAPDSDPKEFNRICDQMIADARDYYQDQVGEGERIGDILTNLCTYYGGDPVEYLFEGELVLLREDRLNDDELPLTMPAYKYEGEVPEGFIMAYRVWAEYVPVEVDEDYSASEQAPRLTKK